MTSDRAYRNDLSSEMALPETETGVRTQFDPELSHVFAASMRLSDFPKRAC